VLGWLGLDFTRRGQVGNQGQVHVEHVIVPQFETHLTNCLEVRQRFDITHGTADFDQHDIGPVGAVEHRVLDFIGDMRDDLYRCAEVITAPLLGNHAFVDTAGRVITALRTMHPGKPLVVPQVEIGFGAIIGNIDLAVLEWAHGSGIDIDVRIQLYHGYAESACLQ
jgi:hypothetical protein